MQQATSGLHALLLGVQSDDIGGPKQCITVAWQAGRGTIQLRKHHAAAVSVKIS